MNNPTQNLTQNQHGNSELKPCPFCGAKIKVIVCDYEGNRHDEEYENDPWSGLGYELYHDIEDDNASDCPIA